MKVRPVGAELFHADRRTDRKTGIHDEANGSCFAILQTRLTKRRKVSWNGHIWRSNCPL